LPAETRDALLVAAAAEADPALVARVAGADGALQPAIVAGIVEPLGDTVRFTHPLLAAVAAAGGTRERRREVHRALACETGDPQARARHLALAVDDPDEAVAASLDEAAAHARLRGALPDAAELSMLAVRLTPPEHLEALARRRIAAATASFLAGDDVTGISLIEEVLGSLPSGTLRAEAIFVMARRTFEDVARTVELLDDALHQEAPPDLQAELHVQYAWTLWRGADPEAALRHARTALDLAEPAGDARLTCDALVTLAAVTWGLGRGGVDRLLRRALELESEACEGWLYVGDRPGLVVADVLGHDARFEESVAIFTELLRDARQAGDEPSVASVLWNLGTLEILSGDWGSAREHLSEAVRLRRQEGVRPMESLASLAMLRACEGDIDEARADAAEAISTSIEWRDLEGGLFCLQAAGLIELTAGMQEAACEPLTKAAASIRSSALRSPDLCSIVADEIEALLGAGRIDEAGPEVAWLEEWTRALGGWTVALARRSRGHLCAALGDIAGARIALEEAVTQLDRARIPFECARALLILGAVERRAKQKRAAREAFSRAAEMFDALGAPVWAERTRGELGRVGGRAPAPGELTDTERRVAELVAAGRTNREVAEALFMSPRTVEAHLTRVYAKLGIHSRTELAATLVLAGALPDNA
jgi:DNA-binding CsgD family transcriptional regulator